MAIRNPGNDSNLLRLQYACLRDALNGYYSGKEEQVLNVATTLRVLVHDKPPNRSLLVRLNPDYWDLTIYDKPPVHPRAVFALRTPLVMTGGGTSQVAIEGERLRATKRISNPRLARYFNKRVCQGTRPIQ